MCGRYTNHASWQELYDYFNLTGPPRNVEARYNIAPTQDAPVIRLNQAGQRELVMLRWGLVPFWATDLKIGNRMINARSETVAEKPAFRAAFKSRRCIIPATGFYEWMKTPEGKMPHHIVTHDRICALAGIWERWDKGPDGPVESFTILTTEANLAVKVLHDRMPSILEPKDYEIWLDPTTAAVQLAVLAKKKYPPAKMKLYPVSRRVNSPSNDEPACIEPVGSQF